MMERRSAPRGRRDDAKGAVSALGQPEEVAGLAATRSCRESLSKPLRKGLGIDSGSSSRFHRAQRAHLVSSLPISTPWTMTGLCSTGRPLTWFSSFCRKWTHGSHSVLPQVIA